MIKPNEQSRPLSEQKKRKGRHRASVSAEEHGQPKRLGRRAYAAGELPEHLVDKIAASKMAAKHRKLDRLLEE